MGISIIVAHDLNFGIGKKGKLLTKLPRDMEHFVEKTKYSTVVMGRKTYESIGKPLIDRINIVLSRDKEMMYPNTVKVVHNISAIQKYAKIFPREEIFVIGGEEIYRQLMPFADTMYITEVIGLDKEADAFFPPFALSEWEEVAKSFYVADENNPYDMIFETYRRVQGQVN